MDGQSYDPLLTNRLKLCIKIIEQKALKKISLLLFSHHHHPATLLLQPDYSATTSKGTTGVGDVKLANGKKQLKVDLEGEVKLSADLNKGVP